MVDDKTVVKKIINRRISHLSSIFNVYVKTRFIDGVNNLSEKDLRELKPFSLDEVKTAVSNSRKNNKNVYGYLDQDYPRYTLFFLDNLKGTPREFILNTVDHEYAHVLQTILHGPTRTPSTLKKRESQADRFMDRFAESSKIKVKENK